MATTIILVALMAIGVAFLVRSIHYRQQRILTCPETQEPIVAAGRKSFSGHFIVTTCTRWPERAGCDQACAWQVDAMPEETLVRSVVAHWYGERHCVYCSRAIRDVGGAVAPALLAFDGTLREWKDVPAEDLPPILANSFAVCANCELVEDFRLRFPDRIVERPAMHIEPHPIAPTPLALY